MNQIQIKMYNNYKEEEILSLYKAVGWSNYFEKPQMLKNAYENSLCVLAAYDNDKICGIIRTVGDGHSIIYIQDIIVLPSCQRQGIGSTLLKTVLDKYSNVYQKVLLTDNTDKTVEFYKSIGFKSADEYNCVAFLSYSL